MLKIKKTSIKIAALIGIVELLAMSVLFVALNYGITKILKNHAISSMNSFARDRAQIVETYIENCCDFIDGYGKSPVVSKILQDKNNPANIQMLSELTSKYASGHNSLEGLYVAEWDTNVLSHIDQTYINKAFRQPDDAKALERKIKAEGKPFCLGIIKSPVTGKMILSVYTPVFDEKNEAIGFAGAAFFTETLSEKIAMITDDEIEYSLINASSNDYIFNKDPNLVGTNCNDFQILKTILSLKKSIGKIKSKNFRTREKIISCYYMPKRDWAFVIEDSIENVFGIVKSAQEKLIFACILITIIMVLVCAFTVDYMTFPLREIKSQIERFKSNDYTRHSKIKKYCSRNDEFGTIANAVEELHSILENQHLLFSELLEAQTVGTLVTNAADTEIILINKMAIQLYGLAPAKKSTLTLEKIKSIFTQEEREKIAKVRELAKNSKEEIVYETSIIHGDGRKLYFLSHAKSVRLSNGELVIIFSFIDTTAQKNLEENLLHLSETDPLTTISNRRSGENKIRDSIRKGKKGMFCLFDANKFKYVNDTFGHSVGDKVLIEIANCMKKSFRPNDILTRLGGDEFVVFEPDITDKETGKAIIENFIKNIGRISIPELKKHKISISIGAVLINDNETFEQIYKKADSLMYDCKSRGGNVYKFY